MTIYDSSSPLSHFETLSLMTRTTAIVSSRELKQLPKTHLQPNNTAKGRANDDPVISIQNHQMNTHPWIPSNIACQLLVDTTDFE